MLHSNTNNIKQTDGGRRIKQGDTASRFGFVLLNEQGNSAKETGLAEIRLYTNDKQIIFAKVAEIVDSEVSFILDKVLPLGIFNLEIAVEGRIYPSHGKFTISVVDSALVYVDKEQVPVSLEVLQARAEDITKKLADLKNYDDTDIKKSVLEVIGSVETLKQSLEARMASVEKREDKDTVYDDNELRMQIRAIEELSERLDDLTRGHAEKLRGVDFDKIKADISANRKHADTNFATWASLANVESKIDGAKITAEANKKAIEELKARPVTNTTSYNDSELRQRVFALEQKADKDTVYDDSRLTAKIADVERKIPDVSQLATKAEVQATQGRQGADGQPGRDGAPGKDGAPGQDGKSAYQTWLDLGNQGSEQDFIDSLRLSEWTDTGSREILKQMSERIAEYDEKLKSVATSNPNLLTNYTSKGLATNVGGHASITFDRADGLRILQAQNGQYLSMLAMNATTEALEVGQTYTVSFMTDRNIELHQYYFNQQNTYGRLEKEDLGDVLIFTRTFTIATSALPSQHLYATSAGGRVLMAKLELGGESTIVNDVERTQRKILALESKLSNLGPVSEVKTGWTAVKMPYGLTINFKRSGDYVTASLADGYARLDPWFNAKGGEILPEPFRPSHKVVISFNGYRNGAATQTLSFTLSPDGSMSYTNTAPKEEFMWAGANTYLI